MLLGGRDGHLLLVGAFSWPICAMKPTALSNEDVGPPLPRGAVRPALDRSAGADSASQAEAETWLGWSDSKSITQTLHDME